MNENKKLLYCELLEKFDGNPEKSGRIFFNVKHVTPGSAKPKM